MQSREVTCLRPCYVQKKEAKDGAELSAAIASDPNLSDTDGDGVSDKDEIERGTDPNHNPANDPEFVGWVPQFSSSPSRWEWKIENVQLVWDHTAGALAPNIWNEDTMISFGVRNPNSFHWRPLGMLLRHYNGALSYIFNSDPTGAFSASGNPSGTIWASDYGNPPVDLTTALGFSGYGPADISDRLQFRTFAQRGATPDSWSLTFEIRNQTTDTVVITRSYDNSTATANVDNGTVQWTDGRGEVGQPDIYVHQGTTYHAPYSQ